MKIVGEFAATNAFSSHRKPVHVISVPTRLAGRRCEANRPVAIHTNPTPTMNTAAKAASSTWSDRAMTAAASAPTKRAASAGIASARVRGFEQQLLDALARQLGLGHEPARAGARHKRGPKCEGAPGSTRGSPRESPGGP